MASVANDGGKADRRRRIAERGSDRMALITGRINALPPAAPSSSTVHRRHGQSLSISAGSDSDENNLPPRRQRPQSLTGFGVDYHEGVDEFSGGGEAKRSVSLSSTRLKHQGGFRYSNMDNFEFTEEEPLTYDSDTASEASNYVYESDSEKMKPQPQPQPPSVTSSAKNSAQDTQQLKQPRRHSNHAILFSSRELNSCILASETTRALSSLIIASLVVFYYMISKTILATRPIYIVLLTDVTIVLARLFGGKAIVSEETEEEKVITPQDGHNWGDAVKLLERGLVAYQAIRGVFIDCSIYIVVVVCGTSFM